MPLIGFPPKWTSYETLKHEKYKFWAILENYGISFCVYVKIIYTNEREKNTWLAVLAWSVWPLCVILKSIISLGVAIITGGISDFNHLSTKLD